MPALSKALSNMSVTIPMPHLPSLPSRRVPPPGGDHGDDDDSDDEDSSNPHFIRSATVSA